MIEYFCITNWYARRIKLRDKFQAIATQHETILEKDNKIFNIVGYIRIFALVMIILLGIFMFSMSFPLAVVIALIIAIVAFAVLWIFHSKLHNKIHFHQGIVTVCTRQLARISGEWVNFKNTGAELADTSHPYARDLDIVGAKSLFQFINTTHTWHGRKAFAKDLLAPSYSTAEIEKRQTAVEELSQAIEFTSEMQYYLSQVGTNAHDETLIESLSKSVQFIQGFPKRLLTYMPVLTILLLAAGIVFQISPLWLAGAALVAVQMLTWGVRWHKTAAYLGLMGNLPYKLGKYAAAINAINSADFKCEKLKNIQTQLTEASEAVNELEKIAGKIDVRHNVLIYFAVNALLLWDFHCAFMLENWKRKYAADAHKWFDAIAEFESLQSFSNLPNICTNMCLPQMAQKEKIINAENLGHPLLPNESRITNNVKFDNDIFIISGSNMSGKTTFMRTVGINLILARAGSFVCAGTMACTPFDIMTSMRISDDLNEGISTFYAELKRIKAIIDAVRGNANMFFLIDEIFKGTNSVDRLAGAEAVISQLEALNAVGMISTHDLELCNLASKVTRIKNFSFSEHYQNNNIHFSYKIKQGQSQTTNAKFLMQMVGITSV